MAVRRLTQGLIPVRAVILAATCSAVLALASLPSQASAFSEFYGGYAICGSNCYIQSAGAHTFAVDEGWTNSGTPALACQLFNSSGVNTVTHGSASCIVYYFGGAFVWARVYNQSSQTFTVFGYAQT